MEKEVVIVWPPVWNHRAIHIAVPALTGYLREHDIKVSQFDANISFFRHICSKEWFEHISAIIVERNLNISSIERDLEFGYRYHSVKASPLPLGVMAHFSDDADELMLKAALSICTVVYYPTVVTTDGIYYQGSNNDSDFLIAFAQDKIKNPFIDFYEKNLLPYLAQRKTYLLGISVSGEFQLGPAITLAAVVKSLDKSIHISIGGGFFSTIQNALTQAKTRNNIFKFIDSVVLNEGEKPLLAMSRALAGNASVEGIKNVCTRRGGLSSFLSDTIKMDEIAEPVFCKDALKQYFSKTHQLPLEISRGCYYGRCAFCNLSTGTNAKYRIVSPLKICQFMSSFQKKYHVEEIIFSTLAISPNLLRQVSRYLIDYNIDMRWSCWIRPENNLTKEDVDLAKQAGCRAFYITPESFSQGVLDKMRKGLKVEKIIEIIQHIQEVGLCKGLNILPGFPGETLEEFWETIEMCRKLKLSGEFYPFHLLKNSPAYNNPEKYDIEILLEKEHDVAFSVPYRSKKKDHLNGFQLVRYAEMLYPESIKGKPGEGLSFDFKY